jgi:hypothetical protein
MIIAESPGAGRLRNRAIFLSASVPDPERDPEFERDETTHIEVGEAVVSLARAVFSEGGRLVFGGHPSISPLVALVAGEYLTGAPPAEPGARTAEGPPDGGAPVIIYQSRAFEHVAPPVTRLMEARGQAVIRWIDTAPAEGGAARGSGSRTHPDSLLRMRLAMLQETRPTAMVCIGGMRGVLDEARLFAETRRGAPVYVLENTAGAAAVLGREPGRLDADVRVIDRIVLARLREIAPPRKPSVPDGGQPPAPPLPTPYPLIMQSIVRELIDRERRTEE